MKKTKTIKEHTNFELSGKQTADRPGVWEEEECQRERAREK